MKSVLLLLMASAMGFSATAADSSLMAYNSAFAKRNATVEAANKECLKALQALTKTAKGETLTMIWQGIKELDPQNEEALKFLANTPTVDLLGQTDPNSVINAAKAQILEKLIKIGKYTGKDWESFPGQPIVVKGEGKEIKSVKKGGVYIIVPNPEDRWKERADKPLNSYKGEKGQMQLIVNLIPTGAKENVSFPVVTKCLFKVEEDATLKLTAIYGNAQSIGEMRVKIYEVIP